VGDVENYDQLRLLVDSVHHTPIADAKTSQMCEVTRKLFDVIVAARFRAKLREASIDSPL
jgi:hypothetical protein